MALVKSSATSSSGLGINKVRSPVSSSRVVGLAKGISPLTPPSIRSKLGPMSPTTTNGASPSLNSSRASPAASKPGTPLSSARVVVKPLSAAITPRVTATPRAAGAFVSATQQDSRPQTPTAAAPKVPMLKLRTSISPSPSIDRRSLAVQEAAADGIGVHKKAKPCITMKRQEPSLIFKKLDTPRAPSTSAYAAKHVHCDPFSKERQRPTTPKISQRNSVPRPADNVSASNDRTTGRKVGAGYADKTNPINQDDSVSIARAHNSPSVGRYCAPSTKAPSPTSWEEKTNSERLHLGKRCNSAPASTRCADDLPRRGISVTNTNYGGTLKGVWVPEKRVVRPVEVKAPYAQNTPRASTPSGTATRRLVTPFATNTPRGAPTAAATPLKRSSPSLSAPYHTLTPRGATPKSVFQARAPFHTNTPRGPRPPTPTQSFVTLIQ
ncbi:Hypothetical protein, putative [Bodo saltans]|uniref:Uncharacterized protein n=1 Tax=Bodo saltans TaxID=75058 RepID=A0A0S4JZT6_BODSA|nr:Hypothetical protein, putative [Bodo saltans]|eukprot:CUG94100.1 Hypothetical protein, putative [Bodo saltans]